VCDGTENPGLGSFSSSDRGAFVARRIRQARRTARNYVIGPGDCWASPSTTPRPLRDVRVSASGVILLPLIPQPVQADGLTPEELAMSLAREFEERQILRNPQITVLVKEYKSRPVAVLGAVKKPQMLPVYGPITLLEVLSAAEGLTEDAGPLVYVTRGAALRELPVNSEPPQPEGDNPRVLTIKIRDLMDAKDPTVNVPIYAGDMVTVRAAALSTWWARSRNPAALS
jgi:protein involved in polysaccharide export with SLBB domain